MVFTIQNQKEDIKMLSSEPSESLFFAIVILKTTDHRSP